MREERVSKLGHVGDSNYDTDVQRKRQGAEKKNTGRPPSSTSFNDDIAGIYTMRTNKKT